MSGELRMSDPDANTVAVHAGDAHLFTYVFRPTTPTNESPRPYAHPIHSLAGDLLTNLRPNDHPWHHGLSLTLGNANGINFWGGPTYAPADGYKWRDDHGEQRHLDWITKSAARLEHTLDWREAKSGRTLLHEKRCLRASVSASSWVLRWTSSLTNVSGEELTLGNYHSLGGLEGSHYTGLQFRGARDLLDDHGDNTIRIAADGDVSGETDVHGSTARWMEWHCQHDGSLRRTRVRFENLLGDNFWFVRRKNPVAAFAFHREKSIVLPIGGALALDHQLTFTSE